MPNVLRRPLISEATNVEQGDAETSAFQESLLRAHSGSELRLKVRVHVDETQRDPRNSVMSLCWTFGHVR
jgi:hypothetical protein